MGSNSSNSFRLTSSMDPVKAREGLLRLAELDPEFAVIYKDPKFVNPIPDFDETTIREGKGENPRLKKFIASQPIPEGLQITHHTIPSHDGSGYQIKVRTYVPRSTNTSTIRPIYFRVRGGGFCIGSIDDEELNCRYIATEFDVSVVSTDYRLAPENLFPVGLDDAYDVLKWTILSSTQKAILASTSKGFIISGISSGGNFAAVFSLRARDDPLFEGNRPTGVILQAPSTSDFVNPPEKYKHFLLSTEQNASSPILSRKSCLAFRNAYNPLGHASSAFPLIASSHKNLPPTFIQVAGFDPLRDDGMVYEMVLREDGVRTRLAVYPGVPHAFSSMWPQMKISEQWKNDLKDGTRWLLDSV